MKNKVYRECSSINEEDLELLLNDEIVALIVRNYVQLKMCTEAAHLIENSPEVEKYFYEVSDNGERKSIFLGVSRFGVSFSTTFGRDKNSSETIRYYDVALKNITRTREIFSPLLSPIDKLRLELDETYSHGANIAAFEGKKMFCGIARVTHAGMDLQERNPHVDSLPPNFKLEKQFSANIYLSSPEEGGELVVYPMATLTAAEVDDFEANQQLWSSTLPEGLLIKPNVGDLILINTRRPHAVKMFPNGSRVSLQTFIGYNPGEPLKLWC